MSSTTIKIKEIPSIFPTMTFEDCKITDNRIRLLPDSHKEIFETSEKWKTVTRQYTSSVLKIQSIFRNKYELQLLFKENTNIDIVRIAGCCSVTCSDGTVLDLYVISVDFEKVGDTNSYVATITFFILDEDYKSVVSYLIKDNILQVTSDSNLHKIVMFSNKTISPEFSNLSNTYTIYSCIVPKFKSSEIKEKSTEQSGIEYISNSIDFKILDYICYLTEEEQIIVSRYMPRCSIMYNPINGTGTCTTSVDNYILTTSYEHNLVAGQFIRLGNEIREIETVLSPKNYYMKKPFESGYTNVSYSYCTISSVERIIPKIDSKDMVDCYECRIELKYNQIDFDNY